MLSKFIVTIVNTPLFHDLRVLTQRFAESLQHRRDHGGIFQHYNQ